MSMFGDQTPYEWLTALQKRLKLRNQKELIAMSKSRDPFLTGKPSHVRGADWFAEQWGARIALKGYLRRLHYALFVAKVTRPVERNGKVVWERYRNNKTCWGYLNDVSVWARDLNRVDPLALEDHRSNPIDWNSGLDDEEVRDPQPEISLDEHNLGEMDPPQIYLPTAPQVSGYDYEFVDEPYAQALVIEKSTGHDVLGPLCVLLGIDYLRGTGFTSHVRAMEFIKKAVDADRPAVFHYVSDGDDAGGDMPTAFARRMEFFIAEYPHLAGAQIVVHQVALTPQQIDDYKLPLDEDTGTTELDALIVLYPGALEAIITEAVEQWRDPNFRADLREARREAQELVDEAVEPHREAIEAAVEAVTRQYDEATEEYLAKIAEIHDGEDMAAYHRHAGAIIEAVADLELPARPEPVVEDTGQDWLYRWDRNYFKQLKHYKLATTRPVTDDEDES